MTLIDLEEERAKRINRHERSLVAAKAICEAARRCADYLATGVGDAAACVGIFESELRAELWRRRI